MASKRRKTADTKKWIANASDERAFGEGAYFDPDEAEHAIRFFENCLYFEGNSLTLLDWQHDLLSRTFGWMKPSDDGPVRRMKRLGCWIAKKNGKSLIASGLILYLLLADGELKSYVFSAATSIKNAKIIFDEAAEMAKSSPLIAPHVEIVPSTNRIIFPATSSKYEVLSSRAESSEGFRIHGVVLDELHAHRNSDLFNSIRYGIRTRKQPLVATISTAGIYDPESVAWRQYQLAVNVRDGVFDTITDFLPIIYEADEQGGDDWTEEKVWLKANPALRVQRDGKQGPLGLDDFRKDVEHAKASPHDQNTFKRYSLNCWTQSETTFLTDVIWNEAPDITLTDEQVRKIDWFCGLDLSSTIDISAAVLVGKDADGFVHVRPTFWVSKEQARTRQEVDGIDYFTWIKDGFINETDGYGIQYDRIKADLEKLRLKYRIKKLVIDRWQSNQLAQELADGGWPVAWWGQGFRDLSGPTKEFERLAIERKLVHGGHPVMRWMVRNVVLERDAADNIKPTKKRSKEKIDGVVAACMGLGASMVAPPKPSPYEGRGLRFA